MENKDNKDLKLSVPQNEEETVTVETTGTGYDRNEAVKEAEVQGLASEAAEADAGIPAANGGGAEPVIREAEAAEAGGGEYTPGDAASGTPKRGKKKIILIIIGVLFLLLLGYRIYDNFIADKDVEDNAPVNVKISTAQMGDIEVESPITAKLEANEVVAVVPMVAGNVTAVYAKNGDYVKKGTTLFKIDNTQASAQVTSAGALVTSAQNSLDQAKGALDMAETNYERMKYLYEEGAIALADFEAAELSYSTSKSTYESAKAQVASANASYQSAASGLDYYTIKAPISGYVSSFTPTVGCMASQSVMGYISDTSKLNIETTVTESMAAKINEGDPVDIYISTLDKTITGKVKTFSKVPNVGTVTYPITISLDNKDNDLIAGLFAEVRIVSDSAESVVVVPSEAVVLKNGESVVVTLEGNTPVFNKVETGLDNGEYVEIKSGIRAGDTIVVSGQAYVKEGTDVNIVE